MTGIDLETVLYAALDNDEDAIEWMKENWSEYS